MFLGKNIDTKTIKKYNFLGEVNIKTLPGLLILSDVLQL